MTAHRFALGEIVLCTERRFDTAWKAPYVIDGRLASDAIDPLYRIRSLHWNEAKVAGEHELSHMPQPCRATRTGDAPSFEDRLCMEAANLNALSTADLSFALPYRQPMFGGHHV